MALAGWHAKGEIKFRDHVLHGIESFPEAFDMLFSGSNQGKLLIQLESEAT
jgi:NADPH-dependent curcumin reductase CurA